MNTEELKRLAEAATPGPWEVRAGVLRKIGEQPQIATIYRPYNSQFIAAAAPATVLELIRQRDELLAALSIFMEVIDRPPAANCSCHISPPCNDCVENFGLREAFSFADAAIAKAESKS